MKKLIANFDYFKYLVVLPLLVITFFTFQQGDLLHTTKSSFGFLNNHFIDFYDYNKIQVGRNDYLPFIYIIFAAWNIPIKLLNLLGIPTHIFLLTYWAKILLLIFYIATAVITFNIYKYIIIQQNKKIDTNFVEIFLLSPILLYTTIISGQYDIIELFFIMLAFYFYIRKYILYFCITMSMAISIKYIPIILFLPLLLFIEKNFIKIFRYTVVSLLFTILQIVFYLNSPAFREFMPQMTAHKISILYLIPFSPLNMPKIFYFLFALLCTICYILKNNNDDGFYKKSINIALISLSIFILSVHWHPQWLVLLVPFFLLSTIYIKDKEIFLTLDIFGSLSFIIITLYFWQNNVDIGMMKYGVFQDFFNSYGLLNGDLIPKLMIDLSISFFIIYLFIPLLIQFVETKNTIHDFTEIDLSILIKLRFLIPLFFFISTTLICLFAPRSIAQIIRENVFIKKEQITDLAETPSVLIKQNTILKQEFYASEDNFYGFGIKFATYGKKNRSLITIELHDSAAKTIAQFKKFNLNIDDNKYVEFKFPPISNSKGRQYYISVTSNANTDRSISIWLSKNDTYRQGGFLVNKTLISNDATMYLLYDTKPQ